MKGGKKPTLDAKEVIEQWLEFWGEERASIDDDWVRKTVVTYYHVYNNLWKLRCIDGDLNWFIVDHLCEPINDN